MHITPSNADAPDQPKPETELSASVADNIERGMVHTP